MIAARGGQFVEEDGDFGIIGFAQTLHVDPAELVFRCVFARSTHLFKNLGVITGTGEDCVPALINKNQSVAVAVGVIGKMTPMLACVEPERQPTSDYAMGVPPE